MRYKEAEKQRLIRLKDDLWKILPLFEQDKKRENLSVYIESLLFELNGFDEILNWFTKTSEFITIYATLDAIADEIIFEDCKHSVIKRELFKCLRMLDRVVETLGDNDEFL